jgi:hypothetical protein
MEYQDLDTSRNEIRLITILNDGCATINCTLAHAPLYSALSFKALSYCWGDAADTNTITINGHEFQATSNLVCALQHLRTENHGPILIDALCINQHNIPERNNQVLRMGEIYSTASDVIAWLGLENDGSTRAIEFQRLVHRSDEDSDDYVETLREGLAVAVGTELQSEAFESLAKFFRRPFWKRIWILQEVALAPQVTFKCGPEVLSLEELRAFRDFLSKVLSQAIYLRPKIEIRRMLGSLLIVSLVDMNPRSLIDALLFTCGMGSQAADEKDYIYGILGMSYDGSVLVPRPDYDLSLAEIFRLLAQSIISRSGYLEIICLGNMEPRFPSTDRIKVRASEILEGLPSWAPNFMQLLWAPSWFGFPILELQNPSIDENESAPIFLNSGLVLSVSGLVWDKVDGLSGDALAHRMYATHLDLSYTMVECTSIRAKVSSLGTKLDSSPYSSLDEVYDALIKSLLSELPRPQEVDFSYFWPSFSRLWGQEILEHVKKVGPRLHYWLCENKDFQLKGRYLCSWSQFERTGLSEITKAEALTKTERQTGISLQELGAEQYAFGSAMSTFLLELGKARAPDRRVLVTDMGYIGSVHAHAKKGDLICIMDGCSVPIVLRPREGGGYIVVGNVFMYGLDVTREINSSDPSLKTRFEIH